MNANTFALMDERLDRLVNIDIGNRGNEPIYAASRALSGGPLTGAAADALLAVPFAAPGDCPCGGGIGAVSNADILVTAPVSNWGCTAIIAAMALRQHDARLIHTPDAKARLLEVMTAEGLINSADGVIDPHVDGIAKSTPIAVTDVARAIVVKALM